MNGNLAVQNILANDADYKALVGGATARVYYDEADQTDQLPFAIVKLDSIEPTDDKDGVSTLDHDFVYVTHFAATMKAAAQLATEARGALDRVTAGTYNGIAVQSIQFLNQRSGSELLVDKKTKTMEQQYKVITIQ